MLQTLKLHGNDFGENGVRALAHTLRTSGPLPLQHIELDPIVENEFVPLHDILANITLLNIRL